LKHPRTKPGSRAGYPLLGALLAGGLTGVLAAAEIDLTRLPPAATAPVDFVRDVKPILDTACLRCHGPEKPKGGFRLDTRAAAFKGGDTGVAILPGDSARSPLIHYVARLVEDMEMPPAGKGDPLSAAQVGVLRGWIDQGLSWVEAAPTNVLGVTIAPTAGWLFAHGDQRKFREHYWRREGWDAGLEHFEWFQQSDPDTKTSLAGHAYRDDYRVTLKVERNDLGFVRAGWEQYRKYYDDTGGYLAPRPPQSLGTDLHLDLGKAWIDLGLTLPHWPRLVLGYEYDYKQGEEAITSWGSDGAPGDPRNIAPASKRLDEGVHIIKFDLDAEVAGITIEDRFRGEFYHLGTHATNQAARASVAQDVREEKQHFEGANSIRLEKQVTTWLFGSGGYFYSKLDADDSFTDLTTANATPYLAEVPQIELTRESHLFNLNGLLGPFDGLTLSAGAQSEWTRQHGFGRGDLNGIAYTRPPASNLQINPATLSSDYCQNTVSETLGLRYSKVPFTALFADARFKQESIDQSANDLQPGLSFVENPSFTSYLTDLRAGFHTSPWQRVSWSAHYRFYENDSRYETNTVPQPEGGYPGLIRRREVLTDEIETKLVVRPAAWLKAAFTYQHVATDYKQDTRPAYDLVTATTNSNGGRLYAGQYDANVYSAGLTFTPRRRWALSGTFSYQETTTTTPGGGLIRPYQGDIYSAWIGVTYILTPATDLALNYSFSLADYARPEAAPNPDGPPPPGIRYEQHAVQASLSRRIRKNITTRLQYGYYRYEEPTLAGANDYRVHAIFATLAYRFP